MKTDLPQGKNNDGTFVNMKPSSLLSSFKDFLSRNGLLKHGEAVLLAVSGGVDSVVMTHLFAELNEFPFALAHCNFKLRGKDSEQDELFVKELSLKLHVPFFSISFDTKNYAQKRGISIQMAARDLRYDWLEKVRKENKYDKVSIAHHINDSIETMLLNLTRGTGISGLAGIKSKNKNLIRPLLFLYRQEVEDYALANSITFRTDSSNSETKYKRNKIRKEVIPVLQELNPDVVSTLFESSQRFSQAAEVLQQVIKEKKKELIKHQEGKYIVEINKLKKLLPLSFYLFEFLKEFGFNTAVCAEIEKSLSSTETKTFFSANYKLVKDRAEIEIIPNEAKSESQVHDFLIFKNASLVQTPLHLIFEKVPVDQVTLTSNKRIAYFDADKLKWPLKLRKWKPGDVFTPLGMTSKKKLSDFFIDSKVSAKEKKNLWLLTMNDDEIIWVINYRINDKIKVTEETKNVLVTSLK